MRERVTIVIPTYKRPNNLIRAIESGLSQDYEHIQIVVVDDNSSGDSCRLKTEELMTRFTTIKKVKYIKHQQNKNASAARNTAILNSNGEYIAFLDDDDYFLPSKISEQLRLLKENPDCDMVCTNYTKQYKNKTYKIGSLKNQAKGDFTDLILSGKIDLCGGSTLLVKRSVVSKIGGFDESFIRHQDWEFMLRLFKEARMVLTNKKLTVITTDGIRNYPKAENFLAIKEKFLNKFATEINGENKDIQKEILNYQWGEVCNAFFLEFKFVSAIKIISNKKIKFGFKAIFNLITRFILKIEFIKNLFFTIAQIRNKER